MFGKIVFYLFCIITVSFSQSIIDSCQSCNQILATSELKSSLLSDFENQASLDYALSNRISNSIDDGPFRTVELQSIEQDIVSTMQVNSEELQTNVLEGQTSDFQDLYSQSEYSDDLMNTDSSINALGKSKILMIIKY